MQAKDKNGKDLKKNDTVNLQCTVVEDDGITVLCKTGGGMLLRVRSTSLTKGEE